MAIQFNDAEYYYSHGKLPRGTGSWAFADNREGNKPVFVPYAMTLSKARAWMKSYLKKNYKDVDYKNIDVTVYILP
jgi:hypothetical protein